MQSLSWFTFHRWQFEEPLAAADFEVEAPRGAHLWLCGPESPPGADGLRTRVGRIWGGAAFHDGETPASAVVESPQRFFPGLPPCSEHWHVLLRPIRHRGETNWFTLVDGCLELSRTDSGGPVAVITSAGFESRAPDQVPRMARFSKKVDGVLDWFDALEANVAAGNYGPTLQGADGMTFSLWKSEQGLVEAAYQPGLHRERIDEQKALRLADRTSYIRARALKSSGTWGGSDPLVRCR